MGVPSEKASGAAETILREAEYLRGLDPMDIFSDTRNELLRALSLIEQVVWAGLREGDEGC